MNWYVKSAGQRMLSKLPFGVRLNDLISNLVGEQRHFDRHVTRRLPVITRLVNIAREHRGFDRGEIAEIGTGWAPLWPVLSGLCGARCNTFDVTRYLKPRRLQQVLETLRANTDTISSDLGIGADAVRGRFDGALAPEAAGSLEKMLEPFGATYHAPVDTTHLDVADNSFGLCFSNLVLTHIPVAILEKVLAEFYRVLAPGGIALHRMKFRSVELLKYSSTFWDRYLNSAISYNNRLHSPQFKTLFADAGYELVDAIEQIDEKQLEQLDHVHVAEEFRSMTREELATSVLIGVWRKP